MDKTRPEYRSAPASAAGAHMCLHLVLCGEKLALGGMAFDLAGVKEIVIGRGGPLAASSLGNGKARIDVPDQTISGDHVRVLPEADQGAWIEDLGSRNGTRLLGRTIRRAPARDGDWFVVGRSAFLLRKVGGVVDSQPHRAGGSPRLATFVPALAHIFQTAVNLAPSRVPIMLVGETGTGKDVVAQEIHDLSKRSGKFVAVNCAALPETLVESELFGYRKGAFSDAREDRLGLIRSASEGTLLLDEIGDLPLASQAKLLRVLQDGQVLALGSNQAVQVDLRVIAATQQSLDQLVREGKFRADLLGRLSGFTIQIPPLRERVEDLGLLTAAILERHAGKDGGGYRITSDACCALLERRWPLNVRELERVLQAAIELGRDEKEIDVKHLSAEPRVAGPTDLSGPELQAEVVRLLRLRAGNVSAVARDMGKARMQIHRWMSHFGIKPDDFRPSGTGEDNGAPPGTGGSDGPDGDA